MLTAGPTRAKSIHTEIFRLDVDLDLIVDLRIDEHRRKRRMPARGRIEWRDTHQPMHTDLRLQQPKGVFAVHFERHRLDAGAVAFQAVRHNSFKSVSLGPAQVQPE